MSEMSTEYAYSVRDKGTGGQPDPKGVMSKFCVISQLFANKNIRGPIPIRSIRLGSGFFQDIWRSQEVGLNSNSEINTSSLHRWVLELNP